VISFKKYTAGIMVLGLMCAALVVHSGYRDDAYEEYTNKNYDEAIAILNECLEAAPNDEDCSLFMAQVYEMKKDVDKAIEMYSKTIVLAPEAHQAHYGLGKCSMYSKDWKQAEDSLAKAVEILTSIPPDTNLSPEDLAKSEAKKSATEFKYLQTYGNLLVRLKKYDEALEPLKKVYGMIDPAKKLTEKEQKQAEKIMQDLDMAFQASGKKDEAITLFEKAVEINPNNTMALKFLGSIYMSGDDTEKVRQFGEKLIEMKPNEAKGYIYRGYGELKAGNFSAAEQTFTMAIEKDSNDSSAYFFRGMAKDNRLGTGASSYQTLINDYAKAIELANGKISPEWHFRLGRAYQLEGLLYWDRAFRHEQSKKSCKNCYSKARAQFKKAGDHALAKEQLRDVNERLHRINITE